MARVRSGGRRVTAVLALSTSSPSAERGAGRSRTSSVLQERRSLSDKDHTSRGLSRGMPALQIGI